MYKVEVTTHSGEKHILTIEEYNPEEINDKLNDSNLHAVLVGSNNYSRIDVKNIILIEN